MAADFVLIPGPWANLLNVNGTLGVPDPWEGTQVPLDGATLVMTWRYGAVVAMGAALTSFACALLLTAVRVLARRQLRPDQHGAVIELG